MIAWRRVLCGSSVYVQKNLSWSLTSGDSVATTAGPLAFFNLADLAPDRVFVVTVAVEEGMANHCEIRNAESQLSRRY